MKQTNYLALQNKIESWANSKSEEDLLKEDEYMLMANYLSEIERLKRLEGLKLIRKDLAKEIGVTASYLSQVFTGDKPLNFYTIAKIQKALKIRFEIRASSAASFTSTVNAPIYRQIRYRDLAQQSLSEIGDRTPVFGSNFLTINKNTPVLS